MIKKNEKLIANTFNNHFADITKSLKLKKYPNCYGQSLSSIIISKTMKVESFFIYFAFKSRHS